ncbi:MAG: hypothetical protein L6R41_003123 [Letrouitia leprolyta]|nr:MAG: hypothetical protein L6R41_003123 [Letrouitia leprolyta]
MASCQVKEHNHPGFLRLPFEIRQLIYDELLVIEPDQDTLLYDDRTGVRGCLLLYPQILRANKQINTEATPTLYGKNKFQVNLLSTQIYNGRGQPQSLLRQRPEDFPGYYKREGLIYAHCFQRLANIEINISANSIWCRFKSGDYAMYTCGLFLELLRLLAEESIDETPRQQQKTKRLTLVVGKFYSRVNRHKVLFPRWDEEQKKFRNRGTTVKGEKQLLDRMLPLLEAISRKRHLSIIEVKSGTLENGEPEAIVKREVELTEVADM